MKTKIIILGLIATATLSFSQDCQSNLSKADSFIVKSEKATNSTDKMALSNMSIMYMKRYKICNKNQRHQIMAKESSQNILSSKSLSYNEKWAGNSIKISDK